ncbi:MAG: hypothetical protein IH827_03065, partial [Myxococcales bacterium]|nr:hypothetical protein [Myxococcales bacterium]
LDLSQWYNVLNLELEIDVLPNGWGPIDQLQAYVRVEGRYDCVWTRGCGMFRTANTYGDRAKKLPDRLSDGKTQDYAGVLQTGPVTDDNPHNDVQKFNGDRRADGSVIPNRGAFDIWRIRDIEGADDIANTNDDPFRYTMSDTSTSSSPPSIIAARMEASCKRASSAPGCRRISSIPLRRFGTKPIHSEGD